MLVEQQVEMLIPGHLDASADLDSLHYPKLAEGQGFLMYTEYHFMAELQLTPCARLLWKWILLRCPAGVVTDIDLEDFQALTAEHHRGEPYCMKWIRKALRELEDIGLVADQTNKRRIIARHPGPVENVDPKKRSGKLTSHKGNLTSSNGKLSSRPPYIYRSPDQQQLESVAAAGNDLEKEVDIDEGGAMVAVGKAAAGARGEMIEICKKTVKGGNASIQDTTICSGGNAVVVDLKVNKGTITIEQSSTLTGGDASISDSPIATAGNATSHCRTGTVIGGDASVSNSLIGAGGCAIGSEVAITLKGGNAEIVKSPVATAGSATLIDGATPAQMEALKHLLQTKKLSHGLKQEVSSSTSQQVEMAIACFEEDRQTWTGDQMRNPSGYFIEVLRQVKEKNRSPLKELRDPAADPIEKALLIYQSFWHQIPNARQRFLTEIERDFAGLIAVLDPEQGPVRIA